MDKEVVGRKKIDIRGRNGRMERRVGGIREEWEGVEQWGERWKTLMEGVEK